MRESRKYKSAMHDIEVVIRAMHKQAGGKWISKPVVFSGGWAIYLRLYIAWCVGVAVLDIVGVL